jgi:isoleucyl-tRNA synthetase
VPVDHSLVAAMDEVRSISSVSLSLRKTNGLRVRLPLATLTVVTKNVAALNEFADLIADELNVKQIKLVELSMESTAEFGVIKRLSVNARAAGPRIGKTVQAVIQAAKAGDWSENNGVVIAGGVELVEGEYVLDLVANLAEGIDQASEKVEYIGILPSGGFVILDGKVTPALAAEGLARDVIRAVQQARKDADLDVSDRIKLTVTASADVIEAVNNHAELIKGETLSLQLDSHIGDAVGGVEVGDNQLVAVAVEKH